MALLAAPIADLVAATADRYGLDRLFAQAVTLAESGGDPTAVSSAGAAGLMQLMPQTARELGLRVDGQVDERFDPARNVDAGVRYLAWLVGQTGGALDLAAAAYNAGLGAVREAGWAVPPFAETQQFVANVRAYYVALLGGRQPDAPSPEPPPAAAPSPPAPVGQPALPVGVEPVDGEPAPPAQPEPGPVSLGTVVLIAVGLLVLWEL